jgi:hypothetical protein
MVGMVDDPSFGLGRDKTIHHTHHVLVPIA